MNFVLPGNRDRYKSLLGSILTFVMGATILTYASIRINTFKDPSESTVIQTNQYGSVDPDFRMGVNLTLDIAFGLSRYSNNKEDLSDPTYGKLKATAYEWSDFGVQETTLKVSPCVETDLASSLTDLNENRDSKRFFPIQKTQE